MDKTTKMADGVASAAATTPSHASSSDAGAQHHHHGTHMHVEEKKGDEADGEDDMPLLFMDRLPSDFTSNAQLAAIATFMDDSDTEQQRDDSDSGESDFSHTQRSSRRQVKQRSAKRGRKQAPYAKPTNSKSRSDTSSAKELQLYLSMFKM